MENLTIGQVVGANVRDLRREFGLTLSDLSVQLREYGINWSTGRLSDIEVGRGTVSVHVLLSLALALTEANGRVVVPPRGLLDTDDAVVISDELTLQPESFARLVDGKLAEVTVGDAVGGVEEFRELLKSMKGKAEPGLTRGQMKDGLKSFALADERAAKKLELTKQEMVGASYRRWGRLMSQEVDARAPEGATAQKRGHITRELIAELEQHMDSDRGDN